MKDLDQNQDGQDSTVRRIGQKGMDVAKAFAKRAIKEVAKKIIKKIVKVLFKLIAKAILKAVIWFAATIGLPVTIAIVAVCFFAGAAVFIGSLFGWFDDDSNVDIEALKARYEQSVIDTSSEFPKYRVPIWILQAIDNIRILKEDREPDQIDPEGIAEKLTAELFPKELKNTITINGSVTSSTTIKVMERAIAWNRDYKYTYDLITDERKTVSKSRTTGSEESGGTSYDDTTITFTHFELLSEVHTYSPEAITIEYFYEPYIDTEYRSASRPLKAKDAGDETGTSSRSVTTSTWKKSPEIIKDVEWLDEDSYVETFTYSYAMSTKSDSSNSTVTLNEFTGESESSSTTIEKINTWKIKKDEEIVDFTKFNDALVAYGYTVGDFDYLHDAIEVNDPSLNSIEGYDPQYLLPDEDGFGGSEGGTGGGGYTGGTIADSPNIPGSKEWAYPTLTNAVVTSPYGWRIHPVKKIRKLHKGIDIARSDRSKDYPIYAVEAGTVTWAGFKNDGYGYSVMITHRDGVVVRYAHMVAGSLQVSKDDEVKKGAALGIMGQTGLVTGIHLHLEVYVNGKPVNPAGYLRREP